MSDPWLKFYPSDWRADPALRMCSIGARGLWMEMLCVMHEAEPRGTLRINGKALTDRQLASLAGSSIEEIANALTELEEAGVFSRDEQGTIVSRRMVRDDAKAKGDKANGKKGGNPTLKVGVNPQDKAQKPEARSHNSDAAASGAAAPISPRDELWSDGVSTLKSMTGKTEGASRQMVGKWLKDASDDCALVLSKIRTAKAEQIGDPVAWVTAAVKPPPKPMSIGEMFREDARQQGIIPHEQPTSTTDRRLVDGDGSRQDGGSGITRRFAVTGNEFGRLG